MKLQSKTRVGGRIIKVYDESTTPYQRLINSNTLEKEQLDKLQAQFKTMNPFTMKKELDEKLKWFFRIAEIKGKSYEDAG
jgi:alkylated DNA nucleotide flippase Atl1